jgi:hypothetical protein
MAVLANHPYRFCGGNPVVAHGSISLSSCKLKAHGGSVMGDGSLASGSNQGRTYGDQELKSSIKLSNKYYHIFSMLSMHLRLKGRTIVNFIIF